MANYHGPEELMNIIRGRIFKIQQFDAEVADIIIGRNEKQMLLSAQWMRNLQLEMYTTNTILGYPYVTVDQDNFLTVTMREL